MSMIRIFRSPEADFEHDAEQAAQVYDERALAGMAEAGFNGVWVRIKLRELLPHPRYPSFGTRSAELLGHLRQVIATGTKHGVRLFLYCQEPLGMDDDDPFWKEHPHLAGVRQAYNLGTPEKPRHLRGFCTSVPEVRDFVREGMSAMARALPGLGGVITITASEFQTHCYSSYRVHLVDQSAPRKEDREPLACPRCRERHPSEIVAELLNLMREGLDESSPELPLVAWNWSWIMYEPDPQPRILNALRPGIDIQADFERGGRRRDPSGREIAIDEYALGYAGPSERFLRLDRAARASGRRVFAKLQISTTHELATVSNLPLVGNLYEKARAIRELGLAGFMGCWNFGNTPGLNSKAFNFFLSGACPAGKEEALQRLAEEVFPGGDPARAAEAWNLFAEAFAWYPFSIPFLYHSPLNWSLALPFTDRPLRERPVGRSWLMDPRDDRDDLERCLFPFPVDEVIERLEKTAARWADGLAVYEKALAGAGGLAEGEDCAARAVWFSLRSAAHLFRLYRAKKNNDPELPSIFRELAASEIALVEEALPVYERDPRQGYHGEAHGHMVTPELLRAKLEVMSGGKRETRG